MLSSMSATTITKLFFYVSKTTTWAGNFKIYHHVALDSLYASDFTTVKWFKIICNDLKSIFLKNYKICLRVAFI